MIYKLSILLSGLALVVCSVNTFSSEALRYNPFEQPDFTELAWGDNANANATASAGMELRGTVIDGDDSVVNIDGKYYRLNHEVSGYRVIRIESGSVTLSRGGNEKILTLHKYE